jgi:hypothetical protein
MNCQYCGKKIGILENWRYGRFCSKEHQEEFREEANQLGASVLNSRLGRPSSTQSPGGDSLSLFAQPAPGADGERVETPDPPMMEVVKQDQPAAVRLKPPEPPAIAPVQTGDRDLRCLKILASLDRVPPSLEKDSRRRLALDDSPFRFGTMLVKGSRRVLVPPSGAVQKRPKLMLTGDLLPLRYDETGGPMPEFAPAWQSETAWGDGGGAAPVAMDFGQHLEDYTIEQPWEEWDWDALLEEAKYFQVLGEKREKQRDEMRTHKAQEKSAGPSSQEPGRPGYPAMPSRPSPGRAPASIPASSLAPAGLAGSPSPQKPRPAGQPALAPSAGGPGGMFLPALPAYPGLSMLRAGAPGSAGTAFDGSRARPTAPPQAGRGGPAQGDHGHVEWVELAPPLFLALCKIDDPAVVRANAEPANPPCLTVEVVAEPFAPAGDPAIAVAVAHMPLGPQRLHAVEVAPPLAPEPLSLAAPAVSFPALAARSIPNRRPEKPRLALPPPSAHQRIVLDLRPLPPIKRPHLTSRIVG